MCPTRWEVTTGVEHSEFYGTQPEVSATVGGEIGAECRKE